MASLVPPAAAAFFMAGFIVAAAAAGTEAEAEAGAADLLFVLPNTYCRWRCWRYGGAMQCSGRVRSWEGERSPDSPERMCLTQHLEAKYGSLN